MSARYEIGVGKYLTLTRFQGLDYVHLRFWEKSGGRVYPTLKVNTYFMHNLIYCLST